VGPVRQRQLIRLSSVLVALNLAAGLTAVYAHSTGAAARKAGGRVEAGAPPASGGPSTTAGSDASGAPLAAGHFARRRGSGTSSSTLPTSGPATTSPPTGAPITPAPGPTSSSAPPDATRPPATSAPAPGTTAPAPGTAASTPTTPASRATTTTSGKPAAGPPGSALVTDATGDTFIDGTQNHITEPRADIVKAAAAYDNGNISFALETQKAEDPRTDPNWSSDATYIAFDVDTTGDGKPDFEVQYSYGGTGFGGEVIHPGDDDSVPPLCDATAAGYTAPAYWVTINPSCLGNPSSFAFRATTYFDTNPKDDNADVASDVAPNGGMSFAITRPSP